MVLVPGHPRAGQSPYVFEHILVAEELLGRYLVAGRSRSTTSTGCATTTGPRTLNCGLVLDPRASA